MGKRAAVVVTALAVAAAAVAGCDLPKGHDVPHVPFLTVRDTIYEMYVRTLRELPDGYTLDSSRYGDSNGTTVPCDITAEKSPSDHLDVRDLLTPEGTDRLALIARVGDIWRAFGWTVEDDKSGTRLPSRTAHTPDGYRISIEYTGDFPPSVHGSSPCLWIEGDHHVPGVFAITRDTTDYGHPK